MNMVRAKYKMWTLLILFLIATPLGLVAFESGPNLQLRAEFGGTLTNPSISKDSLTYLNRRATGMSGNMSGLLMGGEVEAGYIFRAHDYFGVDEDTPFSGVGVFAYLGFSQGNTSQKISVFDPDLDHGFDMFINVDFLPVINFGARGKAYFFNNRLALGLSTGARMIADMNPQYLQYSTDPETIGTEIGKIIVTEEMMKKMNPFMFSMGFSVEYSIEVLPTTELNLGLYTRYNLYKPKYLTVPPKLAEMAEADNPDFDIMREFPDYRIDSFDVGVHIGLSFRL